MLGQRHRRWSSIESTLMFRASGMERKSWQLHKAEGKRCPKAGPSSPTLAQLLNNPESVGTGLYHVLLAFTMFY